MPLVALCFCEVLQQLQHFKSGRRIFSGNYDLSDKAGKYNKKKAIQEPYAAYLKNNYNFELEYITTHFAKTFFFS